MAKKSFFYLFILIFLTIFSSFRVTKAESEEFRIDEKDKNVLHFHGSITSATPEAMERYLDAGVDTVVITSGGGDGEAGLRIGKAFRQHQITVIVEEYCFSSCANYLFIGATKKYWLLTRC